MNIEAEVQAMLPDYYHIKKQLGKGGRGEVFLAEDVKVGRMAALKVMEAVEPGRRLEAGVEIALLAERLHPAFPVLYDVFFREGKIVIAMEYIEGASLLEVIGKEGPIEPDSARRIAYTIAESFAALHSRQPKVIYRDCKPANIILSPDGACRIIDLGAAVILSDTELPMNTAGTYGYGAPEQFGRHPEPDERSDIYALGATLHHMLTAADPSRPPYVLAPICEYVQDVPKSLEEIVAKCTNPKKEQRFGNMNELKAQLECGFRTSCVWGGRHSIMTSFYTVFAGAGIIFFLHFLASMERFNMEIQGSKPILLWLTAAVSLFSAALLKKIRNFHQRKRFIRCRMKNIWRSMKKGPGLLALILSGSLFLITGAGKPQDAGEEGRLPLITYNDRGQKIVIQYDAVYEAKKGFKMEIPQEYLTERGIVEVEVSCIQKDTGEKAVRTIKIKGASASDSQTD